MLVPFWLVVVIAGFAFAMGYQQNEHLREYKKRKLN
jgi:hypothetical protein